MDTIPSDDHHEVYRSTGLDVDNRVDTFNDCISRQDVEHITYISFAKELPGFQEFPIEDQIALLRGMYGCNYKYKVTVMGKLRLSHVWVKWTIIVMFG